MNNLLATGPSIATLAPTADIGGTTVTPAPRHLLAMVTAGHTRSK